MSIRLSSVVSLDLLLKIGAAGTVFVTGTSAAADTNVFDKSAVSAWVLDSDFDLSKNTNARAIKPESNHRTDRRNRERNLALDRLLSNPLKARFPQPRWELQFDQDGPMIEIAGLGAGRDDAPSLLHLWLGWNF